MNCLTKEKCDSCKKSINIGQCITECARCLSVIHSRCFKKSNYKKVNEKFYCKTCHPLIPACYNPFRKNILESDDDSDLFFNNDQSNFTGYLNEASQVLEKCGNFASSEDVSNLLNQSSNNFNTYFYNIDGNKTNFNVFASELLNMKGELSAIGIAETNVNADQKQLYPLLGYKSYYSDKLDNKQSGTGIALYIHEKFNATKNNIASMIEPHIESLFLKVNKDKLNVNVGIVYRPPNSSFSDFLSGIRSVINTLPKTITYLMGDFNLNLHKTDLDSNVEAFEDFFLSEGLFPVISLATHYNKSTKSKSCIDNIFTNCIDKVTGSGVIGCQGSAHSPIFATSKLNFDSKSNKKEKITQFYNFSKKNTDAFLSKLDENYNSLIGIDSENLPNFSTFFSNFNKYLDESCKLAVPKCTVRNAINNPWITDSIILSIEKKEDLYKNWKSTCTKQNPNGDRNLHKVFSDYRKTLKHIINFEKKKLYDKKFMEASGDPKKTWEIINQIRGKQKKSMNPIFIIDNERIIERRVIANEFNKYFISIACKLNENVQIQPDDFKRFMPCSKMESMFLSECTEYEIEDIINNLQIGKSSDIPIGIIKKSSKIISPILTYHFNYLMHIGKFPDELKLGKVTPIYKKDNEELLENYRPVSTLPIFGKLFEKIIYSRLYSYFSSQGILHNRQFGFRKYHSTNHALNYSIDHIKQCLNNDDHVIGIFIDLSKAFDTIDHEILLQKLQHYGVRGNALKLLKSYLTNRRQYVSTLGEISDQLKILYGVPQGSCLGPLLFLIYINDMSNVSATAELVLFADDTNIFVKGRSKQETYDEANRILKDISNYMLVNKLHINLDKSCFMYFTKGKYKKSENESDNESYPPIMIGSSEIKKVSEIKFLGIIIDENLSWDAHIKSLSKKLASCTGSINQIAKSIPESLYRDLYCTLFECYMTYGLTVWGSAHDSKIDRIFLAQKKIVRVLFGDREKYLEKFKTCVRVRPLLQQKLSSDFYIKEPSKPLFNNKNILNVKSLYFLHTAIETFKVLKFKTPIKILDLYDFSSRSHKELFILTPMPSNTFCYKSSIVWNKVRNLFKVCDSATSVATLKSKIKSHLLQNQSLGDTETWVEHNFMKI